MTETNSNDSLKKSLPNWHHYVEPLFRKMLQPFVGKKNLNFLEIGSFAGDSAFFMLSYVLTEDTSKITCVDTWTGSKEYKYRESVQSVLDDNTVENEFDFKTKIFSNKVIKNKSDSFSWLLSNRDKEYDFIYIDGDHLSKVVLSDALLSWDLLKVGGIMAFDDYNWSHPNGNQYNPKIAIDSFIKVYKPYIEIIHTGAQVWIKKIK